MSNVISAVRLGRDNIQNGKRNSVDDKYGNVKEWEWHVFCSNTSLFSFVSSHKQKKDKHEKKIVNFKVKVSHFKAMLGKWSIIFKAFYS